MIITLNSVQEDSKEAQLLKNTILFYDHFAVPHSMHDEEYWGKVTKSARNICDLYKDTEHEVLQGKMIMGMMDALEQKAKWKDIEDRKVHK